MPDSGTPGRRQRKRPFGGAGAARRGLLTQTRAHCVVGGAVAVGGTTKRASHRPAPSPWESWRPRLNDRELESSMTQGRAKAYRVGPAFIYKEHTLGNRSLMSRSSVQLHEGGQNDARGGRCSLGGSRSARFLVRCFGGAAMSPWARRSFVGRAESARRRLSRTGWPISPRARWSCAGPPTRSTRGSPTARSIRR